MYLFFVRHFNDIDHMTPIAWKMKKDGYPVSVYCMNPSYDIDVDYRLNFLKQNKIPVDYIYNDFDKKLGLFHRVLRFLFLNLYALHRRMGSRGEAEPSAFSNLCKKIAGQWGDRFYRIAKKRFYDLRWAKDVLAQSEARVLCFDWIRPRRYVVDVLTRAAKDVSLPVISLPHGVFLYTNESVRIGATATEESRFNKFDRYDHVVVQNELRKKTIARYGIEENKILVLGSARYCNDWMEQNRRILPRKMNSRGGPDGKLKTVLMTTKPFYRINTDQLLRTCEMLAKLEDIEVVIKPHTRTTGEEDMYQNVPLTDVSSFSSVELCEWADVVLVIASSIIIEALSQNKPVLYLKHLHENTTEYEEFQACWTIHNDVELKEALLALRNDIGAVPYTRQNVDRWLTEIVGGGKAGRDVLGDYEHFIVNCNAKDTRVPVAQRTSRVDI